jgi:hypothetical protein
VTTGCWTLACSRLARRYDYDMSTREFDDAFVRFYMRHVVALRIECGMPNGARATDIYTSFVLQMRGEWFLVTSGHGLKKLLGGLPNLKDASCSLFDAWRPGASRYRFPFPLLDARVKSRVVCKSDLR